jgi:ABC-2 type transport system permease protein
MRTIYHIIVKELLQFKRDKRMMLVSFLVPVVQLLLLGYAATTDVRDIPMLVYNQDKSSLSREFVNNFINSGYFELRREVNSFEKIDQYIESGDVWLALVIPQNFTDDILSLKQTTIQLIADGSDANSANIGLNYASQIVGKFSQSILIEYQKRIPGIFNSSRINPEIRVWYNPELKSRNFMVPGVLAMVLMIITLTLTSLAIVKEKEIGTLEQLMVTPIKPYQLIIGKLLPFVLIAAIDVALVIVVARFWFLVPLRGSILLLLGLSCLFVLTTLGLGLFVSTISKTQQQAMMTAQFFFFMPFIFFSGFAFPIENMPKIVQYLTYLIPLRYYITIIRGIFLKGVGIAELWHQAAVLLAFGVVILSLSVLRFRKRLS